MINSNDNIDEATDKLIELMRSQDKALKMANEIINMKSKLVMLCEEETALYKEENARLHRIIFALSIGLGLTLVALLLK